MRNVRVWVAASALLVIPLLVVLPGAPASSHSVTFSDPTGDAKTGPAGQVPAAAGELARVVDVTGLEVGGETGFDVEFAFTTASLDPGPGYYAVNGATYTTCFQWSGVPGWFRVTLRITYNYIDDGYARLTEVNPTLHWLDANLDYVEGDCSAAASVASRGPPLEQTTVDVATGSVRLVVPRVALSNTARAALDLEELDPPTSGESLKSFFVEASADYNRRVLVSDRAPDAGAFSDPFVLDLETYNTDLVLEVETNILDKGERETRFAVTSGGFQAVPVRVLNKDAREHAVLLNASLVVEHHHDSNWEVRIVPRLLVPAAGPEGPGVRTATLIVATEPGVPHKEVARVLVTGKFEDRPGAVGATMVDVVATVSPDEVHRTLYLHSAVTERGMQYTMNTLRDDPDAQDGELKFSAPGAVESPVIGRFAQSFRIDVPPTDDLIVDATVPILANLTIASSPAVAAEVRAYLLNGDVELASGGVSTDVGPDGTLVSIPFLAKPPTRTADTVTWRFEPGQHFTFRFDFIPQPRQANPVFGNSEAGEAKMILDRSDVTVPILDTTKRVGVNLTDSGALVSLAVGKVEEVHLNPGKTKVFNLTVQNEGVRRDTVVMGLRLNQSRGFAVGLERSSLVLEPGEGTDLRLLITAPEAAEEDERFEVTVLARSKRDAEAEASATVHVIVTRGVEIDDPTLRVEDIAPPVKKKDSPAVGAPLLMLLVALAALSRRTWWT